MCEKDIILKLDGQFAKIIMYYIAHKKYWIGFNFKNVGILKYNSGTSKM